MDKENITQGQALALALRSAVADEIADQIDQSGGERGERITADLSWVRVSDILDRLFAELRVTSNIIGKE